jgi:D-glycero-D-manno-heptose 1,7-bisphosphate phosphatase
MKLIILDRDGVINIESEKFIKSPEEWLPIPGSLEAIAQLNQAGFTVAVATNQSGIGRGLFTEQTLQQIHAKMQKSLEKIHGHIDTIFYCPHLPTDDCECRKPKTGLFQQIAAHYNIALTKIPAVGDSLRDLQAAQAVGCQAILVRTGNGEKVLQQENLLTNVIVYKNLAEVAVDLSKEPV